MDTWRVGMDSLSKRNQDIADDDSLKSRHIQFIALGGTIGTGLFLGIGRAFSAAGPLSLLLGYTFTGIAVYAMVSGRSSRRCF